MTYWPANDHAHPLAIDIATHAGLLAQEKGTGYAIRCLENIARALRPMSSEHRICYMASIAAEVAGKHGVSVTDLKGPSRRQPLAAARQEAYSRCFELRGEALDDPYSLHAIGRFFNRDHSTVHHGVYAHRNRELARNGQAPA